jgi:type IV pilus assembly protein PilM
MLKFLELEPETFGLDISDLSLKIVKLKERGGFFEIESCNEAEIKPGIIESGIIRDKDALMQIIKKAVDSAKGKNLRTKYVIASLPEEKSFLEVVQMPKMKKEEMCSAVSFEAENHVPVPIDQLYFDFQVIAPIVDHLDHCDILLAAMSKEIIDSYIYCLKKSGLKPVALEVESQAIARALIKDEKTLSPVVLVDFGQTTTNFIIFAGNSIRFTSTLPVSSGQITEAISKGMDVSYKEAEKIKEKFDLSDKKNRAENKKISEFVLPVLNNLAFQIEKYINFYREHASHEHLPKTKEKEKIIFCGGGARMPGFADFFFQKLKIPVEIGNPLVNVPFKKNSSSQPISDKNSLLFSTALGLALKGTKKQNND